MYIMIYHSLHDWKKYTLYKSANIKVLIKRLIFIYRYKIGNKRIFNYIYIYYEILVKKRSIECIELDSKLRDIVNKQVIIDKD